VKIDDDIAESPDVVARALDVNAAALADVRRLVRDATLVRVLGIGSSRHAAGYAATCLEALTGVPAAVADAPGGAVPAPAWREGQVAIVLSQSGSTPALVGAVAAARVPVVAIVNQRGPLAEIADVVLTCEAGDERVVAATKTVLAQLALGRAIASPYPAPLDELRAALDVDIAPALSGSAPGAVVAGGFAGGWLADEIALKLAEVAGRAASSEPLVEHLHGPVAARSTVLAVVDGDDPNLVPFPVRLGIDAGATVRVPTTGDPSLDVLTKLVVAQRVVVGWSDDPDADRGLEKVTLTR
jgi:glucosamine--fructose-6-phosphate aminotransferase (isomerizing)